MRMPKINFADSILWFCPFPLFAVVSFYSLNSTYVMAGNEDERVQVCEYYLPDSSLLSSAEGHYRTVLDDGSHQLTS